ncbi:MAG: fumarylacetoacetate hydrolase family protein [bacterium]|nr:fumarylacetoacetate hydrolase family protein [bacterium]
MYMPQQFVRFAKGGQNFYGRIEGDEVIVLQGNIFEDYIETKTTYSLTNIHPVTPCSPKTIVCVGLNYRLHAAELHMELPKIPIIFLKPTTTLLAPFGEIKYWPMVNQLDYEGELAIIIGKKCHQVKECEALNYVFGYSIANDITARDLQRQDGQWTRAKSFDTFLPLGPFITTGIDPSDLKIETYLNGQVKQSSQTSDMIFSVPYIVSFISQIMTLHPGDVIITGTPSGIGPMEIGDEVEVRIEGLGNLINKVSTPLL